MANLDQNVERWNSTYDWQGGGDEWSRQFGGTEALWFFVLYPRIHQFIPTSRILEIAPGFGRWTQFLKAQCTSLIAVDISEKCIEYSRNRFASDTHIRLHVNDGISLDAVPDNSIDFVFSFDSLVHVEKEVIEAYVLQLGRKLTSDGVGFIHHSNLGAYPSRSNLVRLFYKLPSPYRRKVSTGKSVIFTTNILEKLLSVNLQANRASSMTGNLFRGYCELAGLKCIRQELFNWGKGKCLIDAVSIFTRPNSRWDRGANTLENPRFVDSADLTSQLAKLYCA